jgi:hypothetical protein
MDQAQQERDEYINKVTQDNMKSMEEMRKFMDEQNRVQPDAVASAQPNVSAAAGATGPARAPRLAPPQGQTPLDQLVIQNQERVRQQILQTQQQIMQQQQAILQQSQFQFMPIAAAQPSQFVWRRK